jgi:hypothetical protein
MFLRCSMCVLVNDNGQQLLQECCSLVTQRLFILFGGKEGS